MGIFGKEEPEGVTVKGAPLHCIVCQHATFFQRRAQLHGPVATLFNLEWTAPTATCVICSQCGTSTGFWNRDRGTSPHSPPTFRKSFR